MQQMDVQKISVDKLIPAPYNPRKDLQPGEPEYEKLLRSVDEFGYVDPLVWNKRTGYIVGGNQRFKILLQLGYKEIDCVVVDMDEFRERALCIALNKISGEWDIAKVYEVLKVIETSGIDPALTGYEAVEMSKIYQQVERACGRVVEDDFDAEGEAEQIKTPVTQLGDVWEIGRHRLMCGDSTNVSDVMKLLDSKKARMTFFDPPWNVDYGGSAHPSWKQRSILNDKMSTDEFRKFLLSAFKATASVCELGSPTYCVMLLQPAPNVQQ